MRVRRELSGERGAGSVLALAIVLAVVVVGLTAVTLAAGLVARQRIVGAADLAALAAADAASGIISDDPCEVAARVVRAGGASLASCRVDGLVVRVAVEARFGGIPLTAQSAAGPPP